MPTPLTIYRGHTFDRDFNYKDAEGVAIDLTGRQIGFRFRRTGSGPIAEFTVQTDGDPTELGSSLEFIDQATGTFRLKITDEETNVIAFDAVDLMAHGSLLIENA